MIKIKLTIDYPKEWVLRQTPNGDGVWGDYKFYINEDVDECDYWVVFSKGIKNNESSKVLKNYIILIIGEPSSVYHFSYGFLKRFNLVISCDTKIKHHNVLFDHPFMPWWVGVNNTHISHIKVSDQNKVLAKKESLKQTLSVDLKYFDFIHKNNSKIKLLSVITSNKVITKGHRDRLKFVEQLKNHFGDKIDIYGRGFNDVSDKRQAIQDYKYHIVIENFSSPYYWTEKLSDAFLCDAYPLYYGCKNLANYFSVNSFSYIDIYDIDRSIKIIEDAINNNFYEKNINSINEAKMMILEKYNIFPEIIRYIRLRDHKHNPKIIQLRSDKTFVDFYKIILLIKRKYNTLFSRICKNNI